MKVGQLLGTPIGEPVINLEASRVHGSPNLVRLTWDTNTGGDCFFQIWVDGSLYKTTAKRQRDVIVYVNDPSTLHFIEIITVGAYNADEDCYHLLQNEFGNKAIIKWPSVAKAKNFHIYGDDGDGSVDWTFVKATVEDKRTNLTDELLYQWKSGNLITGTYKYGIKAVSWDGSEDPNTTEVPITISTYPLCVSGLTFHIYESQHEVSLLWDKPNDASWSHGRVYHNNGSGEINWDSLIVESTHGGTGVTCAIPNDYGTWKFGVRSFSDTTGLESFDKDKTIYFTMTAGWSISPTMSVAPIDIITSTGISMQYIKLDWQFNRKQEEFQTSTKASHFRIWGTGPTTVDCTTAWLDAVTCGVTGSNGYCDQYWVTPGPYAGGTYRFVIKAVSDSWFEGPARECVVFLYGTLASMVTGITVATSE